MDKINFISKLSSVTLPSEIDYKTAQEKLEKIPKIPDIKDAVAQDKTMFHRFTKKFFEALPTIILALIILLMGYFLAKKSKTAIRNIMKKSNMDASITGFLSQMTFFCIMLIFLNITLSILGVPPGSLIALVGSFGIAIGLALQNNLANFASGIIILIFKPFRVGDYISTKNGVSGTVEIITTMNTCLNTVDNKKIYIPNSSLTSGYLINYSESYYRAILLKIKITFDSNQEKAISLIRQILENNEYIIDKENICVEINDLTLSGVELYIKASVENNDYWNAYYQILRQIKSSFDENNIKFAHYENIANID